MTAETIRAIITVGFCLLLAGFGLATFRGDWRRLARAKAAPAWPPLSMWVLLVGALLGLIGVGLIFTQ